MNTQPTTQPKPVKKLTVKKTSIRVLVNDPGSHCQGPTANCTNPC
jgi:hypothetical protein